MTDNPEQYIHYPQPQAQPPQLPYYEAPQPGVIPLRPLDVGAMITGSFRAMFRNWQPAILVPFVASLVAVAAVTVPVFVVFSNVASLGIGRTPPTPDKVLAFFGSFLLAYLLGVVLSVAAGLVTQTVVTVVVSRAVLGRTTTIGQALRKAAPRMLPLFGLTLLVGLIVFACLLVPFGLMVFLAIATQKAGLALLGILLLLAGGVVAAYLWISYVLATPALILEPAPVLTAMRRSRWLVAGNWWRVFGILLLVHLMAGIASYLAQLPTSFAQFAQFPSLMANSRAGVQPDPTAMLNAMFAPTVIIVSVLLSAVVAAFTQPFVIGVSTLLYHDLRIRKESFHVPLWQMSQLPDELAVSPQPTAHPEAMM
jgi:hypothetical protein